MDNNQNNPQEVPQVKSEEEIEDVAYDMARKEADHQYRNSGTFSATPFGLDGIPHARFGAIAKVMVKFSDEQNILFQSRIAELEKQNSELSLMLENLCSEWRKNCGSTKVTKLVLLAEQALNSKEG